jgi:GNAT superfamily N-acetyltransferase
MYSPYGNKFLGLAEFENGLVKLSKEQLLEDGFGERPYYYTLLAEVQDEPHSPPHVVALALYYFQYSTWEGRTLYLEDLFVKEEYRGKGIGTKMFKELAKEAKAHKCARFQWQVLDWNQKAIDLYHKIGAKALKEWVTYRMDAAAIDKFLNS